MELAKQIRCPKCDSEKCHKYGFARKSQRYKCGLCNGQFTLTKRRETFEEYRFVALQLFLEGLSYRQIAKEISVSRRKISEKTIRKWIAKYKLEEPLLHHRFEQKEKYHVLVTRKTINGNGGLFIKSHSKVFRNKIITVELVPRENKKTQWSEGLLESVFAHNKSKSRKRKLCWEEE
ncbi:MAG: IS1 family transposase [Bacteroidetes bacterium]|nr:IS1 family transposase [Bacteroidota bacterium]